MKAGAGGFGRETNSVIPAAVEFSEVAKEYPIVLPKVCEGVVSVALNARVDLNDGRQFGLPGLLVVDEKKLLASG
jgi:hypothetical protein